MKRKIIILSMIFTVLSCFLSYADTPNIWDAPGLSDYETAYLRYLTDITPDEIDSGKNVMTEAELDQYGNALAHYFAPECKRAEDYLLNTVYANAAPKLQTTYSVVADPFGPQWAPIGTTYDGWFGRKVLHCTTSNSNLATLSEANELYKKTYAFADNFIVPALSLDENDPDREKLYAIQNFICRRMRYDLDYSDLTPYESIVSGRGVCAQYAAIFKILCDIYRIPCRVETGNNHAWCVVTIGRISYYCDPTWAQSSHDPDTFFMNGRETFYKNHGYEDTKITITGGM